jgi:hypothetical protein
LVKSEQVQAHQVESAPSFAWLAGLAGWFIPGSGHLLMKKWGRAALMGGAVWVCFFVGLAMGGHMFDVDLELGIFSWGTLIQIPPAFANFGMGAFYIVSWLMDTGFADDPAQAARATYEYGNTFLLIAGLLNFLVTLDAFDIAAGRKN